MRDTLLPYYRPDIDERSIAGVVESLRNGWLTTGPKTKEFEERIAAMRGVRHAIGLNSATAGIHLALVALGVGPGDEVVLPSLSFVAAAHCVRHCGATPVFCDVEADTLCVSVRTIDPVVTPRTRAIVTMPYAGRPVGGGSILAYARAHGIGVVEDAALAAGTLDDGHWSGQLADAAIFSFYATKNLTTAEGGMLLTNDDELAEQVRLLALHGMDRDAWKRYTAGGTWRYDVPLTGFKYNMPDLAAALGLGELDRFSLMQARREEIVAQYLAGLEQLEGVDPAAIGRIGPRDRHGWCFFPISVWPESGRKRDDVIAELRRANISTSVHYIPSHLFTSYRDAEVSLPITERVWETLISLPLFPGMTDEDVRDVLEALSGCFARQNHAVA